MSAASAGPRRRSTTRITDVETAARSVLERIGTPLHELATVAALEAGGVRDVDAARIAPGCADVFALGRLVHARCRELSEAAATLEAPASAAPAAAGSPDAGWRRVLRTYRYGVAYTVPLLATGVGLALLATSLWGSRELTGPQRTGMALAVVLSLVAAGPLTHAMTRRLFHYWFVRDVDAVRRTGQRWMLGALALGAAVSAALAAGITATGAWSAASLVLVLALPLQPVLWAANAALFVIGRAWVGGAAILAPVVPLWAALQAGADPLTAHLVALAAANVLSGGATWALLARRARGWPAARAPLPARAMPVAVGGFAVWGVVYFLLVFADRLVAWWGDDGFAFRPSYEAALQLALGPLMLVLPILEYVLVRIAETVKAGQRSLRAVDLDEVHRDVDRVLLRLVSAAVAVYAALAVLVLAVVQVAPSWIPLGVGRTVSAGTGRDVLVAALAGYGIVVVGLGVATVYQLTARPLSLALAGVCGVVVNVAVGVAARAGGGPDAAVAGLVAGSAAFTGVVVLGWVTRRRRLAHWWYAGA